MQTTEKTNITVSERNYSLPFAREVTKFILGCLDVPTLGRCAQVCTTFYHLLDDKLVWMNSYCSTWPSCVFDLMDRKLDWRELALRRFSFEKELKTIQNTLLKNVQQVQTFGLDGLDVIALRSMQNAVRDIKDHSRMKKEFQEQNIPRWMTEGTYFDCCLSQQSCGFSPQGNPSDYCSIHWTLYGKNGNYVVFSFTYSRNSDRTILLAFRNETRSGTLVSLGHSAFGGAAFSSNFEELKNLLGVNNLTHAELLGYVTVCCQFREREDQIASMYFLQDLRDAWAQESQVTTTQTPHDAINLIVVSQV